MIDDPDKGATARWAPGYDDYEWSVSPAGRWSWWVSVRHNLQTIGPIQVIGSRERAERKARKAAEDWRRRDHRADQTSRGTLNPAEEWQPCPTCGLYPDGSKP